MCRLRCRESVVKSKNVAAVNSTVVDGVTANAEIFKCMRLS
jgi:hypothetical protein